MDQPLPLDLPWWMVASIAGGWLAAVAGIVLLVRQRLRLRARRGPAQRVRTRPPRGRPPALPPGSSPQLDPPPMATRAAVDPDR